MMYASASLTGNIIAGFVIEVADVHFLRTLLG